MSNPFISNINDDMNDMNNVNDDGYSRKSFWNMATITTKVLTDKFLYTCWNRDLFEKVDRIYVDDRTYLDSIKELLTRDADQILPNLYLGNAFNAADKDWLLSHKITTIVNITSSISNYYPELFQYHNFMATDVKDSTLKNYYNDFYNLISSHPDNIFFVHCYAGRSRSAALVLYYLTRHYNININSALQILKRKRPVININCQFIKEIKDMYPLDNSLQLCS